MECYILVLLLAYLKHNHAHKQCLEGDFCLLGFFSKSHLTTAIVNMKLYPELFCFLLYLCSSIQVRMKYK